MRIIILLLLSLTLFVALAQNFSLPDNWHSSLSAYVPKNLVATTTDNRVEEESEEEVVKESVGTNSKVDEEAPAQPAPQPYSPVQTPAPAAEPTPTPKPQLSDAAQIEAEILRLSNIERADQGLNSLSVDEKLAATARTHSGDMIARAFFSHDNPDGCSSACRTTNAGYKWKMVGENIYMMSGWELTPEEAAIMIVNGWMASPGHRENLLKDGYTESGVGVIVQGEAIYATALYAKPR
jgi:uncharacterized protein YkwD